MTFVEKVEKSFESLVLSDNGDQYIVWNELIINIFKNDSDKDKIIDMNHKILNLINSSDKQTQKKLINTEVSDLINMIKS